MLEIMVKVKKKAVVNTDQFSKSGVKPSYRDVATLSGFLRPRGGLSSRFFNGVTAKTQRQIREAVKRARFLGLLPYINKIES